MNLEEGLLVGGWRISISSRTLLLMTLLRWSLPWQMSSLAFAGFALYLTLILTIFILSTRSFIERGLLYHRDYYITEKKERYELYALALSIVCIVRRTKSQADISQFKRCTVRFVDYLYLHGMVNRNVFLYEKKGFMYPMS